MVDLNKGWSSEPRGHCSACGLTTSEAGHIFALREARRTPAAADGAALDLLPMPAPHWVKTQSYTAEQFRQGQRDAIAHYLSKQAERVERFAWTAFVDNGSVVIWPRRRDEVESVSAKYDKPVVPAIAVSSAQEGEKLATASQYETMDHAQLQALGKQQGKL